MNEANEESHPARAASPGGGAEVSALLSPSTLLDALGVGVAVVRADWVIAAVNAAWREMLDVRAGAYVGRDFWEAFAALRGTPLAEMVRATMADGLQRAYRDRFPDVRLGDALEVRLTRAAGPTGAVLVLELRDAPAPARQAGPRADESEALRDLAHALSEVTESRALLHVLAEAALLHGGASGVAVLEVEGNDVEVVATAGAAVREVGVHFPLADSLTERAMQRRAPVAVDDCTPVLARQLGTSPPDVGPALVIPLVVHDLFLGGLAATRRSGASPFVARDERRLRVIADYAALALYKARLLEEVKAASYARSNFLATVSHELRTPLTALTGYGELLADEIMGPLTGPQHEIVERMRSVTQHLTTMIDEILTFSSIEAGREKVRPTRVLARDVVRSALAVIEPLARQKGLTLDATGVDSATALLTDGDKVRQILVNLAGNAVKFTDRGRVDVKVENGDGTVSFCVRDTGVGIAADDQARLFQPFSQLDVGLTRRHGGTGLGLYISQRLAGLLGGHIDLESAPRAGSTFTLTLPVEYAGPAGRDAAGVGSLGTVASAGSTGTTGGAGSAVHGARRPARAAEGAAR